MKVTTIITYAIGLVSIVAASDFDDTLLTTSGKAVPKSLKHYLNGCSNTDYSCKYETDMQCRRYYSHCRVSTDKDYLEGLYHELNGLTGKEYCSRHNEVCEMSLNYNIPTTATGDIIPSSLLKYINCKDDKSCRTKQASECNTHYKDCTTRMTKNYLESKGHNLGNYTAKQYCNVHKAVCQMAKDYVPLKLPSGIDCPVSLMRYLQCTVGDNDCRLGQSHTCMVNFNDCRTNMTEKYLTSRNHILGNFTPKQYCAILEEVCQSVRTYEAPITDEDVYNLDQYLACPKDDYRCKDKMNTICYAVYTKCINNYPNKDCEKLSKTCAKIYQ
eukprot:jgi/Orpsp1_1/1176763/evm.model.c7180000058907.1